MNNKLYKTWPKAYWIEGEFSHEHEKIEALAVITLRFSLIISRKTAFSFLQVDHMFAYNA